MYALIFDEHDLEKPLKKVMSVFKTRALAENALGEHRKTHGKKVQECNMRVVWVEKKIKAGDTVTPSQFETWRPGETIPEGETHSDED
jgi:sialic acid synthase SpsE